MINSSLYGVIASQNHSCIENVYGAIHGGEGVLKREIIDLTRQDEGTIQGLTRTPGAALGGCRYRVQDEDLERIFQVFQEYNIKYFFYIGGNDSMDTAHRISEYAKEIGDGVLRVIGIPKTIDNDLPVTHHCPGFGSCAKYVATSVREAGLHTASMYTSEPITILQTVGRNTGWLPGASALARMDEEEAPHIICFPEVPFGLNQFLGKLEDTYRRVEGAFIVVGEGLRKADGSYVSAQADEVGTDAFGHPMLGGASDYLREAIEKNLKIKARNVKLDICQQAAMHFASARDVKDAIAVGRSAVKAAVDGKSGYMVTLLEEEGATSFSELEKVANLEREVPREWIDPSGSYVTTEFLNYARPLIQGEVEVKIRAGLPAYVKLRKIMV